LNLSHTNSFFQINKFFLKKVSHVIQNRLVIFKSNRMKNIIVPLNYDCLGFISLTPPIILLIKYLLLFHINNDDEKFISLLFYFNGIQ
jgi:hypothetical protein